jgi:hypothetical protein
MGSISVGWEAFQEDRKHFRRMGSTSGECEAFQRMGSISGG